MKFKAIIGAAVVLGTMMLASVTAHAATFTAGTSNTADSDGRYALPVSVTTSSSESLNGVIIELEYDNTKIEMVEGPNSSYADMGSVCTGGVNVSSTKEKSSKIDLCVGLIRLSEFIKICAKKKTFNKLLRFEGLLFYLLSRYLSIPLAMPWATFV